MLEILIDNRNGKVWNVTNLVPSLTYKTKRTGSASSLDFTLIKGAPYQHQAFTVNNGDVVRLSKDGQVIFYGYVFEYNFGRDESVTIKAYDQLRYLLMSDTYVFSNKTATQMIKQIAEDTGLKIGTLAETEYVIPSMVEDNKKLLDIMCKALDYTLINDKGNFVLYDEAGALTLRNIEDMKTDAIIGDWSLMTDFGYKSSIDSESYNKIKVVQNNKETGKRDVYIGQDSANIAKWGLLQFYQVADEQMNSAQINELLDQLLKLKNREQRSLSIEAIGDLRVRAGSYVPIVIEELDIGHYFLVDECSHKLEADAHTMTLELKVI
ncbi:hypothetical protein [Paenibacillus sp. KS-LC4]|uniref:XkdQ/YqbQ family protein n=1 Tax=Paenibacillus sp. KS-LC4 TaxID=2979727 RepID=UPI0030CB5B6F